MSLNLNCNFYLHIQSGTFWFDAVNEKGKKVEIREGRFDMHFEGWAGKNSN